MDQEYYEIIINSNRYNLTKYLDFEGISQKLIQDGVITPEEYTTIKGGPHSSNSYRMPEFLEVLVKKDLKTVYPTFKEVLKQMKLQMAYKLLDETERNYQPRQKSGKNLCYNS